MKKKVDATFQFMNVPEAAEHLGMTDGRVRQLLRAGELKGHKLGKSGRSGWAIPYLEVERFRRKDRGDGPGRPRIGD